MRQVQVQQHGVESLYGPPVLGFFDGMGQLDTVARVFEALGHGAAEHRVVFHQEEAHGGRGST